MATVKKGVLTPAGEWWKHLRWTKRTFWKGERQAAKAQVVADAEVLTSDVVWERVHEDGGRYVEVRHRSDGLYHYVEWRIDQITDPVFGDYAEPRILNESGLYDTLETAKRDACRQIDWLRLDD